MIPYARQVPGRDFNAARLALYYLQRATTWPTVRSGVARAIAASINTRHARTTSPRTEAVASLEKTGLAMLPNLLSTEEVAEVMDYLAGQDCSAHAGAYTVAQILRCPHILRVISDPRVLATAECYLGARPTLNSIGIRWSYTDKRADVNRFHRDPDDWRFIKSFVYLTDVDMDTGPHVYVLGSHKTKGHIRAKLYGEEELAREYGQDALHNVVGPAGTSFLADTYGIHKGTLPRRSPRLILQIQYSLLPNYALAYNPLPMPEVAERIDPYLGRLLVKT